MIMSAAPMIAFLLRAMPKFALPLNANPSCNYASFARRKCDEQTPFLRLKARDFGFSLELPMDAGSKNVYRPTIAIEAGVCKELIIEGDICRGVHRPTVIGLKDILSPRVS